MQIKRREFLKRSALGVSAVVAASRLGAEEFKPHAVRDATASGQRITSDPATASQPRYYDPYEKVPLGQTKLKVSRFCLGTGVRGGNRSSNQTRMGKEKFQKLIRDSYERGVRLFDLADLYGTHPYLVPALDGVPRDNYQIITKIWWNSGGIPEKERPDADVVIARFLKEIGTDYLDLVLLHCVTSAKWPEELRKQMDILAKFKEKGVVRAHGVSCHSVAALEAAASEPWVDSVHSRINPYGMVMDNPWEKVPDVLKRIHAAGKGVVGMKIVGEGQLRNDEERRDASVRYVLGLGCVDVFNVGFEKAEEIDDLANRVRKVPIQI